MSTPFKHSRIELTGKLERVEDREFYLIRHGESLGNIGLDPGFDPALSPHGKAQARVCAEFLRQKLDSDTAILCSPFDRCVATAAEIAAETNLKIKLVPQLHELFDADWFPLKKVSLPTLREISEKYPHSVLPEASEERWWPNYNETWDDVDIRMASFRNRLIGDEFPYGSIVCVAHWASVQALANAMVPSLGLSFIPNASVTKINYKNSSFEAEMVNFPPEEMEGALT